MKDLKVTKKMSKKLNLKESAVSQNQEKVSEKNSF